MTNLSGTNHETVEAEDIKTGQIFATRVAQQLTSETGPLKHGSYLVPIANVDYFINTFNGSPEVTKTNGMLFGQSNPLFIPIRDPSVIRICSDTDTKKVTFIMY